VNSRPSRSGQRSRDSFSCQIERDSDGRVSAVTLTAANEETSRSMTINSTKAIRIAGPALDVLRAGGVSGRQWATACPIELDYLTGAQLELLLVAVRPLRRAERIDRIGSGVASMSPEEASYWHAKIARPGGLPALRTLFGTAR
jgi:hypothetical protein